MQECDRLKRRRQLFAASPMVTQDAPVLKTCDRMLHTRTASSVSPPSAVAHDAIGSKDRRDQLRNTAIPAICEHSTVLQAEALDHGATVVQRVVAVAWSTYGRRDHMEIASGITTCALHDQR